MPSQWDNIFQSLSDILGTPKDRRSLIRTYVPDMIDAGLNQTESKRLFRDYGFGIRDSDFGEIYNFYARDNEFLRNLANVGMDETMDDRFLLQSSDLNTTRYRYVFQYGEYDSVNKRFNIRSFGIDSNKRYTQSKALEAAYNDIVELYSERADTIDGLRIRRIYINDSVDLEQ